MRNSRISIHYGEEVLEYKLPPGWNLLGNLRTRDFPLIGRDEMIHALEHPLGTPRLEEIAKGKKNAVIIGPDITRPTQGEVALPLLLNALNRAGIADSNILMIMGGGTHLPPKDLGKAYEQKYGQEVVNRVEVMYHDCDRDLTYLGKTKRGHTIEVNKWVAEADLKIAFSGIIPHGMAGYSGGGKSILPAVCSRETNIQNHVMINEPGTGIDLVEGNPIREGMEEAAKKAGLDFIFNLILNPAGRPVGAVSGDVIKAHRQGVDLARKIFRAEIPELADVVFSSGHPQDLHLYSSFKGAGAVLNGCKDGGTIIHLTPAYEGIRSGTRKLFSIVNTLGYKNIFARLKAGEREDEGIRNFFYPEINIGGAMNIFRAMVDRDIRILVVTRGIPRQDLLDMGFEHAETLEEAVSLVHQRLPKADVAAALNSKVVISVAEAQ